MTTQIRHRQTRWRDLVAQIVAVVMLLVPLAGVAQADLANRDPLYRALLVSLCAPGGQLDSERGAAKTLSCCTIAGQCSIAGCCSAITPSAIGITRLAVAVPVSYADYRPNGAIASRYLWPGARGPPAFL